MVQLHILMSQRQAASFFTIPSLTFNVVGVCVAFPNTTIIGINPRFLECIIFCGIVVNNHRTLMWTVTYAECVFLSHFQTMVVCVFPPTPNQWLCTVLRSLFLLSMCIIIELEAERTWKYHYRVHKICMMHHVDERSLIELRDLVG